VTLPRYHPTETDSTGPVCNANAAEERSSSASKASSPPPPEAAHNASAPQLAAKPPTAADAPKPPKTHPSNNTVAADENSPPNNQLGPHQTVTTGPSQVDIATGAHRGRCSSPRLVLPLRCARLATRCRPTIGRENGYSGVRSPPHRTVIVTVSTRRSSTGAAGKKFRMAEVRRQPWIAELGHTGWIAQTIDCQNSSAVSERVSPAT